MCKVGAHLCSLLRFSARWGGGSVRGLVKLGPDQVPVVGAKVA